jgi:hypothetical protein
MGSFTEGNEPAVALRAMAVKRERRLGNCGLRRVFARPRRPALDIPDLTDGTCGLWFLVFLCFIEEMLVGGRLYFD